MKNILKLFLMVSFYLCISFVTARASSITGIDKSEFTTTDFASDITIEITGVDLFEPVRIEVTNPVASFSLTNITLIDNTKITAVMSRDVFFGNVRVATYDLEVYKSDTEATVLYNGIKINETPPPTVTGFVPSDGAVEINEKVIYSSTIDNKKIHFLKVIFSDPSDLLRFENMAIFENTTVYAAGSTVNLLDKNILEYIKTSDNPNALISQYIFKQESTGSKTLFIPVSKIDAQTTYNVYIPQNILRFEGTVSNDGLSETVSFSFTTTYNPIIVDIVEKTVPENYDSDEPIIINGSFFSENSWVEFNTVSASRVWLREYQDGTEYLEVYLPRGGLEPGLYDISVFNDDDHTAIVVGILSVIEQGKYIPDEVSKIKENSALNVLRVEADLESSVDKIILSNTLPLYVYLDLDNLTAEAPLNSNHYSNVENYNRRIVRLKKIKLPNFFTIPTIEVYSSDVSASFNEIRVNEYSDSLDKYINVGKADPSFVSELKRKLRGRVVRSEFIELTAEGINIGYTTGKIKYTKTKSENLTLLRYDESLRSFVEEAGITDKVNQTLSFTTQYTGVFVIVEN